MESTRAATNTMVCVRAFLGKITSVARREELAANVPRLWPVTQAFTGYTLSAMRRVFPIPDARSSVMYNADTKGISEEISELVRV
jgi:hypothetical protein